MASNEPKLAELEMQSLETHVAVNHERFKKLDESIGTPSIKEAGSPGTISMHANITRLATNNETMSEPSLFMRYGSI